MGLLDFIGKKFATGEGLTDEDRRAAARQGLLQLGATLLSTPSNGSQGFGKGLLAGVQGVQDAGAGAVNDRYRKQIMDRTTAGAERNTKIEQAQMGLIKPDGTLDEAKWAEYASYDPKGALELRQAMSKPQGQAPTIKDFYEGSELVQKQWDGQQWVDPTFGGGQPQMAPVQGAPAGIDPAGIRSTYQDLASQFPGTQITSLLRTKQHNAEVGGVPNSQHVRGTAGDFVVPDQDKPAFIAKAKAQGFEAIDEGDHIHLELPPGGVKPFPKSGGLGRGNRYKADTPGAAEGDKAANWVVQQGADGQIYRVNKLTGEAAPVMAGGQGVRGGNAIRTAEQDQKRDAEIAGLQGSSDSIDTTLGTLQTLLESPGMKAGVGFSSLFPSLPGGDAATFDAQLETFRAQNFIPMVSQLKGMGALSDAEGNKLLAAVGALNPKMGEKAFQDSLLNIQANLNRAKTSLEKRTADLYRNRVTPGQKTIPISPTVGGPSANKRVKYNPATGDFE